MAEQLLTDTTALRRSPLAHLAQQMHEQTVTGERGVALREIPFLTMVGIRVAPGTPAAEAVAAAAGMPLPTGHGGRPDRLVQVGQRAAAQPGGVRQYLFSRHGGLLRGRRGRVLR